MDTLSIILLFVIAALMVITYFKRNSFHRIMFQGDVNDIDPSTITALRKLELLAGDVDDDLEGDPMAPLLESMDFGGSDSKSSVFIGDIDDLEGSIDDDLEGDSESDFEGGLLKKVKARVKGRKAKKGKGKTFAPNLPARVLTAQALKQTNSVPAAIAKVNRIAALAAVPGGSTAFASFARLQVVGGRLKITETDLTIKGTNLATAIALWEQYYPGLSRSKSAIAASDGEVPFSFTEPNVDEVTQILAIIITITANELNKVKGSEVVVGISGRGVDGLTISSARDTVEVFVGEDTRKTVLVYFPTKRLKEELHIKPFAAPTTANPLSITLTGVPTGSNVVARAVGMDDEDWLSYKKMAGL